jgi:allantoinase
VNEFAVLSRRVVLPDGIRAAAIHVRGGRIVSIGEYRDLTAGVKIIDAGELVVIPGLVDTHVHMNDPGRADWEGVEHATAAAAAGGITTVVDMPLNSIPPTTTVAGLEAKRDAIRGRAAVDVGFWGGVVPGNVADLEPLARAGVLGFKCFLAPSGVPEFEHVTEADLRRACPVIAALGLPLLVHAEWPDALRVPNVALPRQYATWLASRPPAAEQRAIELLVDLAVDFGIRIHLVHLACADALNTLRAARARGLPITVETCPHYLTFAAEEIADGGTPFKCAPPVREREQRERLWQGLADGDIDIVASDHSPAPPSMKSADTGDFLSAWGGIASLQLSLPAVWTGASTRGFSMLDIVRWMSAAPAGLAGSSDRKGAITAGRDADLVIFDPDDEFVVDPAQLRHRHPLTPYAGLTLRGRVRTTILRGECIYQDGELLSRTSGRMITSAA